MSCLQKFHRKNTNFFYRIPTPGAPAAAAPSGTTASAAVVLKKLIRL